MSTASPSHPAPSSSPDQEAHRAAVDARISAVLDAAAERAGAIDPAGVPLVDALRRLSSGGKRLRAMLAWTGWRAAGGAPEAARAVEVGAAVELFQTAALVHDDILDRSDTRRGMPSVHRDFEARHRAQQWRHDAEHFGTAAAILAGDLCLALSDESFARAVAGSAREDRARAEAERMRFEVMVGQYLDVRAEMAPPAGDPAEALRAAAAVVEFKSARYTAVHPFALGALLAGADDALVAAGEQVLLPFGLAYQYRDDLLGVFGDPETTGKPAGDDLREGKRTVLVARAQALLPAEEAAALDADLGDPRLSEECVHLWRRRLEQVGARSEVVEDIGALSAQALEALEALASAGAPVEVCRELDALIRRSAGRAT
ncbi:polyprenyl synthetase family protein [Micrococcus sp.]|uniref:polyprenyl synthetase family protein n=1 Tax=Micrococcus sp. TaxID=1271 RepID=UPI002A914715|nr:polyprenyl synthetase family protein [Micrococcus sp.]MDY6055574.1 polyprenyl synthetase family protein [Micrococcus sp.]